MPKNANDILDGSLLASPEKLFLALNADGDRSSITAGNGGLGKKIKIPLAHEAFIINVNKKTISSKARNLEKLWEFSMLFKPDMGLPKDVNINKLLICMAFLVKQATTLDTVSVQQEAYKELKFWYGTQFGYIGQKLNPDSKNATLVLDQIVMLEEEFKKTSKKLREEKAAADEVEEKSQLPSRQQYSHSASHGRDNTQTGSTLGFHSESSQIRGSHSEPSSLSYLRQTSTALVTRQLSDTQETSWESTENAWKVVSNFLNHMVTQCTPKPPVELTLREIKTVQKAFFLVNVGGLTLLQLRSLITLLDSVQSLTNTNNPRVTLFDSAREETNFFLRYFLGSHGNTKTWEAMATAVQNEILNKLTQQRFAQRYPNDNFEEFDLKRIVDPVQRIPLESNEYKIFEGLFKLNFGRWARCKTSALEQFENRFIEGTYTRSYQRR